jgi:hypothetical protein
MAEGAALSDRTPANGAVPASTIPTTALAAGGARLDVDGARDEVSPPPDDPPQAASNVAITITKRAPINPRTFLLDISSSLLRNVRSCVVLNFPRLLFPICRISWELTAMAPRKIAFLSPLLLFFVSELRSKAASPTEK